MKKFFKVILLALIFSLSSCTWFAEADCTKLGQLACNHTYEWRTKSPTCQSDGYTIQTCTKCGYALEGTKKDVTSILDHTILNSCGFCGMNYFQKFTEAFMARETVQHYSTENRWCETTLINANNTPYSIQLNYLEQTDPVFTFSLQKNVGGDTEVVTLIIKNASGKYDYVYEFQEDRCEGYIDAQKTTTDELYFDVTSSNMDEGYQILANDIIFRYLRVIVDTLKNNYFPPTLEFSIKHFGFDKI